MSLWLSSLVAILLAVGYTVFLHIHYKSEKIAWFHSLIATFVSVLLGLLVAIMLFKAQQDNLASQERERYLRMLRIELTEINETLLRGKRAEITTDSGRKSTPLIKTFEPFVIDSAAKSGLFSEKETVEMFRLSSGLQLWNDVTEAHLEAMSSGLSGSALDSRLEFYEKNLDRFREIFLALTQSLSKSLGLNLVKE